MSTRVTRSDLSVDPILADFIEDKALPGTGIEADTFWQALSTLAHDFGPRNAELLATRDRMQAELDTWHKAHPGKITDMEAYKGFLSELGYLVPEGELSYQAIRPARLLDTRQPDARYEGRLGDGQVDVVGRHESRDYHRSGHCDYCRNDIHRAGRVQQCLASGFVQR